MSALGRCTKVVLGFKPGPKESRSSRNVVNGTKAISYILLNTDCEFDITF